MEDYSKIRIQYINNWPNVTYFGAEEIYRKKYDELTAKGENLFSPTKMWINMDKEYNICISHLIDSLDMLPYYPNHGFLFAFVALDRLLSAKYSGESNLTKKLKMFADYLYKLEQTYSSIKCVFQNLYHILPIQSCILLANAIFNKTMSKNADNTTKVEESNAYKRITKDSNAKTCTYRKNIIDAITRKYSIGDKLEPKVQRQVACLFKKIFICDGVQIDGVDVTDYEKLRHHLLVSGIIYSFRNMGAHGSSMAFSKSSLTDMKRYALNYFCFLSVYTISMIGMIDLYYTDDKVEKYSELEKTTKKNCSQMRNFFGHNLN